MALAWLLLALVVVPTLADMTSVKGLTNVMAQIEDIRSNVGLAPSLVGAVANMVDERVLADRRAIEALTAANMPQLLGKLPRRRGRDAWSQLLLAFEPVAETLDAILNCAPDTHV